MTKKTRSIALKMTKADLQKISEKRTRTERHLRMSIEDWRAKKRQEWRTVMSALDLFAYGSAYTPAGNDLYELQKAADRIREAMVEDWVCW
jgi:hypothetical protein